MFIYLFGERGAGGESVSRGGAERERGRERIPSRLCPVNTEPHKGLELTNHEFMT